MLGILIKKQLAEIFKGYFINSKNNTKRTKSSVIFMFTLYGVLMVGFIGGMNYFLASYLCEAFCSIGLKWMYFSMFALLSVLLGVFGSVFSTYSTLYISKDNDLLLSMPIKIKNIVVSRIINVYIMGALYSAFVFIPCSVVYFIHFGFDFSAFIGIIVMLWFVTAFVLVLSCLLGWVVAKLGKKLKNKSFTTVVISIVFIGAYYVFYFKAQTILRSIIENAAKYGSILREKAGILYYFGNCADGDAVSIIVTAVSGIVLPFVALLVLSKTFLKIATATCQQKNLRYVESTKKQSSVTYALFKKELARFTSSANYMLNCGFGMLFLPAAGIFLIIKGKGAQGIVNSTLPGLNTALPVMAVSIICLLSAMIDMAAPSVSLEGKNLWLTQSLPIPMWYVIRSKILLQIVFSMPFMLFLGVCIVSVFDMTIVSAVNIIVMSAAFSVLNAMFCMFLGLKMPNLTWTNEIKPIKQSACVGIALFGAFFYAALISIVYFLCGNSIGADGYLSAVSAVTVILDIFLYKYLKTTGAKIFAAL